jgi:hypothetical protein
MNYLKASFLLLVLFFTSFSLSAQTFKVSGTVTEYILKTPIPNATIKIRKLVKRVVNGEMMNDKVELFGIKSDENGKYEVNLKKDEYSIEVSSIGYIKRAKYINLKKDELLDFEVSEEVNQLEDIEVKAQKAEANVRNTESSVIRLDIKGIKKLPIVFGEGDLIKALTMQPGVSTAGEGAGGFNVRGGKVDQNLVLLDDAPIFNTSHLLGLFTSINTEAVQNATLYKAGMPARYGGRLSSMLNITTKASTEEKTRAIGAGPISANGFFQQPFNNSKGSILLATRIAYPNLILSALPRRFKGSKAFFYDFNGTVQYRILPKHNLKITTYQTADNFKFPEDTSYFWGSRTASVHLSSFINNNFSIVTKGIYSQYNYGIKGLGEAYEFKLNSLIKHQEIRTDALYQFKKHKFEFGGSVVYYNFSQGIIKPTSDSSAVTYKKLTPNLGNELSTYVSDEWLLSKVISIQAGVRFAQFKNTSPGYVYNYEANLPKTPETVSDSVSYAKGTPSVTYNGFEPRLSINFVISKNQSIKTSFNRTRQYLHLISNTTAISPIDYWDLSTKYIPPQVANQYSLGYYRNFKDNEIEASIEGFYKKMDNLVEYIDGASLFLNENLETDVLKATGYSYGLELSVQKNKGRFTGNLSYTYSKSLIKVLSEYASQQINNGEYYPSLYDKPHNLTVLGQYFLGMGWTSSASFTYQSGRPNTYPDGQFYYNESLLLNYSKRNFDRLPDFHRFDVSVSRDNRRSKTQKKYTVFNFSIYNLYARRNPYSIYFKQYLNVARSYKLSVLGTAIPSLTITKYW